jgi:hypothetical protein
LVTALVGLSEHVHARTLCSYTQSASSCGLKLLVYEALSYVHALSEHLHARTLAAVLAPQHHAYTSSLRPHTLVA